MKQLAEALSSRLWRLFQQIVGKIAIFRRSNPSGAELSEDQEELFKEPTDQPNKQLEYQIKNKSVLEKIAQKLGLKYQRRAAKNQPFKKASLFPDGKTNSAALSLVLRGVAEVLSQKMDLPWKAKEGSTLSYEKEVKGGKGKICYYVTDNPENPYPETLAEEAGLAVIDQFDREIR